MIIESNEVVGIYVTFLNKKGGKRRPILILKYGNEKIEFFPIMSKYSNKSVKIKQQYYPIHNWKKVGLKKLSHIDIGRRFELDLKNAGKIVKIGKLDVEDINGLAKFVNNFVRR